MAAGARLKRAPGRNLQLMRAAEKRLTAKLASFFAVTARHVSREISARLDHERIGKRAELTKYEADYVDRPVGGERCADCSMFLPPVRCTLVKGAIAAHGHCRFWDPADVNKSVAALLAVDKSSDHPGGLDLHVKPENAEPIHGIPIADAVTSANVQHISWEMARDGMHTERVTLPLKSLIATQRVVDRQRVAKHEAMLREGLGLEADKPPLVILWDGDFFILGGHHGLMAGYNLGVKTVDVDVMLAPD